MRIAIIGSGALATYFGYRLKRVNPEMVMFSHWCERMEAIHTGAFVVLEADGNENMFSCEVEDYSYIKEKFDLALVLVKSYQTDAAALFLKHSGLLSEKSIVLTLQNGMGNLEILQKHLIHSHVIAGSTTQAAVNIDAHTVRNTGNGSVVIGSDLVADRSVLMPLFESAGFEVQMSKDMESVLWSKLVVNCAINLLTAVLGVSNGFLFDNPVAKQCMHQMATEAAQVAKIKGIPLVYQNPIDTVDEVGRLSATNTSSTLADVIQNRPTELPAMNGYLLSVAEHLGVNCPLNKTLYEAFHIKKEIGSSMENLAFIESLLLQDKT